jgi:predicted 2-oxoglutarate/Fe(II)-dependent dioxygenase YbiX
MSNADEDTVEEVVLPVMGRTVTFTSGPENPHKVQRVTSGQRFVLAFWFTRDLRKKFDTFLDGKAHQSFQKS